MAGAVHSNKKRITSVLLALVVVFAQVLWVPIASQAQSNSFVTTSGTSFLLEGKPFYVVGVNSSFLYRYEVVDMRGVVNPTRAEELIDAAAKNGITVMRTFVVGETQSNGQRAYDGQIDSEALQKGPGNWQSESLQAVDRVLDYARVHNVRLILTVANMHRDYGGVGEYVAWAGYSAANDRGKFFSDSTVKNYYKNTLNTLANRVNTVNGIMYKDDPTIFAWDLINEPYSVGTSTLQSWADEMASFLKSRDPNHLVTIGDAGLYDANYPNGANDFRIALAAQYIDFASWHCYPREALSFSPGVSGPLSPDQFKSEVLKRTADSSIYNKPFIVEEFGISNTEPDRAYWIQLGFDYVLANGGAGVFYWQWVPNNELSWHDKFSISPSQTEYTSILADAATKAGSLTPPVVTITSPLNGATVSGLVSVAASASDSDGVSKVEFYIDGEYDSEDTIAPYEIKWYTNYYLRGKHTITARAYNGAGNSNSHLVIVFVESSATSSYVPGEVLVKFKAGTPQTAIDSIISQNNLQVKNVNSSGVYQLKVPSGISVPHMISKLLNVSEVEYIEPNYLREAQDPMFSNTTDVFTSAVEGGNTESNLLAGNARGGSGEIASEAAILGSATESQSGQNEPVESISKEEGQNKNKTKDALPFVIPPLVALGLWALLKKLHLVLMP